MSPDAPAETGAATQTAGAGAWPSSAEGAAEGVPDGLLENSAAEGMAALTVHVTANAPAASPSAAAAGESASAAAAGSAAAVSSSSSAAASAAAAAPPAPASVSVASGDNVDDDDFDPLHLLSRNGPVSGVRDDTEPGDRTQRFSVHSKNGQSGGFTKIRVEDIERDLKFLRAPSLNHCMQFLQACTRRCQYRDLDEKDPLGIGVCRDVTTTCSSVAELEKALRECKDKDLKALLQLQLADVLMFGLLGIPNERRDSSRACNLYYDAAEGGHPGKSNMARTVGAR